MTTELIGFFDGKGRAEAEMEEELPWASREVLVGAGFSEKSDVYSFGIVLWEIMQTEPSLPFAGLLPDEVRVTSGSSTRVLLHELSSPPRGVTLVWWCWRRARCRLSVETRSSKRASKAI